MKANQFCVRRKRHRLYRVPEVSLGDVTEPHVEVSWNHTEKHTLRAVTAAHGV